MWGWRLCFWKGCGGGELEWCLYTEKEGGKEGESE